jgi:hypothetical protein
MRIIKNRILMPHSVNSSKARMVRDTILMLQSVEVAGQELSGVGFQYSRMQTAARCGSLGI